jgi:hypothetical protein
VDAAALLIRLCELIDARRWDDLAPLLHDDFACRYVHTGETFDREGWIRVNADYPGFDRMVVEDVVGAGERAAARCHVTGRGEDGPVRFEVATFVHVDGGRIRTMTEVWTDVAQTPPPGTRPGGSAPASSGTSD